MLDFFRSLHKMDSESSQKIIIYGKVGNNSSMVFSYGTDGH